MKTVDEIFSEAPLFKDTYTKGTSLVMHVSHKLSHLITVEIDRLIKENSTLNLSRWRTLRMLSELGTSSQKELVKAANIDQGQVSRALTYLENESYVTSASSERDKRIRLFSITEQGEAYRAELSPIIDGFHQKLDNQLSAQELDTFLKACTNIVKSINTK